jgi:tetratricopeptide (TPR) repeat protein
VRSELLSLSREAADTVARHLVAAGQIIDEDADLAMAHAIAARRMASRIAVVREAVGLAAYAAGDWATAIAELRTYHRMTGRQTHLAELADCERALGRPERAIDLFRGADKDALDKAGAMELLIVAAGARGDLGQHDAAVAMLQIRELTADEDAEWAARLRYAYADALLGAGRRDEAREWFARAAVADPEDLTDAAERLLELDGVTLEDDDTDDDESDDESESESGTLESETGELDGSAEDDELEDAADGGEAEDDDAELPAAALSEGSPSAGDAADELVGEDPADQDQSEEQADAAKVRAVAFIDGVESTLDSDDDLDDVETDDVDIDDVRAEAGTGDGRDAAEPVTDVTAGGDPVGASQNRDQDDEKASEDEFVAEVTAAEDDPFVDRDRGAGGAEETADGEKRPQA